MEYSDLCQVGREKFRVVNGLNANSKRYPAFADLYPVLAEETTGLEKHLEECENCKEVEAIPKPKGRRKRK
jgi:hypothetical protein